MAHIVVVEDNELMRRSIAEALEAAGHSVLMASDGYEGYETCIREKKVDIIITDHNMPRMTGIEMITMLREHKKMAETIIIFHTTELRKEFRQVANDLKVRGWLLKPTDPEVIAGICNKAIAEKVAS
jgi:two-component system chemotaxis response regulator CheY